MDKLKGMLKVSERDKKLLIVVFAVLIMALAYFLGYSNLSAQVDDLSAKKSSLEVTKKDLKEKNNNKDKYIADTTKYLRDSKAALERYDSGTTQPNTIDFFRKTEEVTGAWVKSLALSPSTAIYNFGQLPSSNVNGSSTHSNVNLTGYKTTVTISYESDYAQWKKIITYINAYANKSTIDTISASYNDSTGVVTGTASISLYAIVGGDRKFTEPSFNISTGTDNIFAPESN